MIQRTPQVLGVHFQSMKGIASDWKEMNNYQVGWRLGIDCIHIPNISMQYQCIYCMCSICLSGPSKGCQMHCKRSLRALQLIHKPRDHGDNPVRPNGSCHLHIQRLWHVTSISFVYIPSISLRDDADMRQCNPPSKGTVTPCNSC